MQWRIGDATITKVVELEATGGSRFILPDATRDAVLGIDWLHPHFMDADGRLIMSIHALIVETPDRRIIVDTCLGNDKQRAIPGWHMRTGPFLDDLAGAGYPRESIDTVLCTHLHVDHVGWNTILVDGKWVPTFPNARYLIGRQEFDHWKGHGPANTRGDDPFSDSVKPVFDAGLVDFVESDHGICPEIRLEPTPGHTPGHVSVRISSKGEEALITGDVMHHPCQMAHPEWASAADSDADQARATRQALLDRCADAPLLVIGTHFAGPTAGHVVRDGRVYRFDV
jgi:glyoxylase-like metal-dependent hydrolase (beta-lactamase superfamily II)